jgi:ornithine cyclodeaminase/alanine dehydrogenase-like protein (mu-crystallin family)
MTLLYLGPADIERLLPVADCIEVMQRALCELARGAAVQPLRSLMRLAGANAILGLMPGQIGCGAAADGSPIVADAASVAEASCPAGVVGIKVITLFHGNRERGAESHLGAVLLFDTDLGTPLAYLDAAAITAIRTAAVSAVATRALARPEAGDLALLGAGVQARTHLAALAAVRPLRRVRVWSRRPASAQRFAVEESERHGLRVEAMASAAEAVAGADLVCTVTASRHPVLAGEWLAPGAHVNAVGACMPAARELDSAAVAGARLFVDRRESALHESGDLLIPMQEGLIAEDHIVGELGEVLLGRLAGRRADSATAEITLFKSLGLAVEDLAAAYRVYQQARLTGCGVVLAE